MSVAATDALSRPPTIGLNAGLDGLSAKLRLAARRAILDRLLLGIAVGLAAALALLGILQIASIVAADGTPIVSIRAAVVAGTGIVVTLIAVMILLLRRPTTGDLARAADRTFLLSEGVSTAIEVAAAGRQSIVGRALLQDVATRSRIVDPAILVAFRLRRVVALLAVAALFAVLAVIATPPETAEPAAFVPPPQLTEVEQADAAENLGRIAALFEEDATERDDPFLQAIAREVAALQDQVERGDIADRALLADELERLAAYATEAYQRAGETPGTNADLTRLLDTMRRGLTNPAAPAAAPPTLPETGLAADPAAPVPDGGVDPAAAPADRTLDDMLAEMEAPDEPAPQFVPQAGNAGQQVPDYYEVAQAEADRLAANRQNAPPGENMAGAELAGPAADAGRGEGLLAGEGQQALDADPIAVGDDPFGAAGEMLLEDELDGDGRRIRVEVPPEAMALQLDPAEVEPGDWRRYPEGEVMRGTLPAGDRDVVARYFRALVEEGE